MKCSRDEQQINLINWSQMCIARQLNSTQTLQCSWMKHVLTRIYAAERRDRRGSALRPPRNNFLRVKQTWFVQNFLRPDHNHPCCSLGWSFTAVCCQVWSVDLNNALWVDLRRSQNVSNGWEVVSVESSVGPEVQLQMKTSPTCKTETCLLSPNAALSGDESFCCPQVIDVHLPLAAAAGRLDQSRAFSCLRGRPKQLVFCARKPFTCNSASETAPKAICSLQMNYLWPSMQF